MHRRMSRMLVATATAAVMSVVGLTVSVQAAHATPPIEFCNTATGTGQPNCFNVKGGVHAPNINVIAYTPGDDNNDFYERFLTSMCGDGKVHGFGQACPFPSGSDLNNRYDGDEIVALEDGRAANLCVGTDNHGAGVLTTCPNSNGLGGIGTIIVENSVHGRGSVVPPFYFINFHWSQIMFDQGGPANAPWFWCGFARRSALLVVDTGTAGICTWQGIVH
jgi:hypothetical protein